MSKINYFAYGSNMSEPRLISRVPSATKINIAKIEKYKLSFNKKSIDGSGKANAYYTGEANDSITGVIFSLDKEDKIKLDNEEKGYTPCTISIDGFGDVYLYVANDANIDNSLKPYDWYLFHLKFGAINTFDIEDINCIKEQLVLDLEEHNKRKYKQGLDECVNIYLKTSMSSEINYDFNTLKEIQKNWED